MSQNTVCKTVHQYNRNPIPQEDMQKLLEIAADYSKVKNYVYQRYGGVASLEKLYSGYTIQNEMTAGGLRARLGLPSVYFYLAVFDALADLKSQWTRTKTKVLKLVGKNENFSEAEKHYLRFLLKISNVFGQVLNRKPIVLRQDIRKRYDLLAKEVDIEKLHNYLCRQVRKYHVKLHTDSADGFSITERAYRYADHGIYISIKEKRKRIFILLTDRNQYDSQLYIKLYPKRNDLEIKVPVYVAVRKHKNYTDRVGIALGMFTMITTQEGHRYGERFGEYQSAYAAWIREQSSLYQKNREANPGRKKYQAQKQRKEEQLHSYINQELNRFLREEKPGVVYMAKLPGTGPMRGSKEINHVVSLWQRGYIKKRLEQKCREQSVELVEVFGKGIGSTCSECGVAGSRKDGIFRCGKCGYEGEEKTNTAKNVLRRGMDEKVVE